ncbi:hypothetical protein [Nakamurella deserti]|uniref:hypothetical protein n=1 Tax=Nakamurella deserti TaxID=2164074 RepID=UPI001300A597|nr:hypothetical protein [Nakamurella deserti]
MRRRVVSAGVAVVLVAGLAGCGGGGTQGTAEAVAGGIAAAVESASALATALPSDLPMASATGTGEPAGPTSEAAVAAPVTRSIDRTGWYDGFAVTVDEATAEPGYGTSVDVTVGLTYDNLGIEDDSPPRGDVEVDGLAVEAFFDAPDIPGGGKARGTATFTVTPDEAVTPAEAIDLVSLVYGDAGDNRTVLPLADSAEVDSIEPLDIPVTGNLTQGQIVVDVVEASLAPSYESGEKGKALLDVRVKLTCAPDCNASGWNTGYEQFSVTAPDGSSVVADQRSDYCCDALYPGTVSDSERNVLTFVVPLPGTGEYTLTYDNGDITAEGTPPATFSFSTS